MMNVPPKIGPSSNAALSRTGSSSKVESGLSAATPSQSDTVRAALRGLSDLLSQTFQSKDDLDGSRGDKAKTIASSAGELISSSDKFKPAKEKGLGAVDDLQAKLPSSLRNYANVGSSLVKSGVVRRFLASALTTTTALRPKDFLQGSKLKGTDKTEDQRKVKDQMRKLGLVQKRGIKQKDFLRTTPTNRMTIQLHIKDLDRQLKTATPDKAAYLKYEREVFKKMDDAYKTRLAVKENIRDTLTQLGGITDKLVAAMNLSSAKTREDALSNLFLGIRDDKEGILTDLRSMSANEQKGVAKLLSATVGDIGVGGLKLLLTDDGIAIAGELVKLGRPEMMREFLENPVQMVMDHKDQLQSAAGTILDHFVELLKNIDNLQVMEDMSGGKVSIDDLKLMRDVMPVVKDIVLNGDAPSSDGTPGPSKSAKLAATVLSHVSGRLEGAESKDRVAGQLSELTKTVADSVATIKGVITALNRAEVTETPQQTIALNRAEVTETSQQTIEASVPESQGWFSYIGGAVSSATNVMTSVVGSAVDATIQTAKRAADDGVVKFAGDVISSATNVVTSAVGSVVDATKETAKWAAVEGGATVAAGELNNEFTKEITGAPKSERGTIVLDRAKVTELMTQTASLVSGFLGKNPELLDIIGISAGKIALSIHSAVSNPGISQADRTVAITSSLKENLGEIGSAIMRSEAEDAQNVGRVISDMAELLSSDLFTRSLEKSVVLTNEGLTQAFNHGLNKATEAAVSALSPRPDLGEPNDGIPKDTIELVTAKSITDKLNSRSGFIPGGPMMRTLVSLVGMGPLAEMHDKGKGLLDTLRPVAKPSFEEPDLPAVAG